jgi:hypothetical protein
MVSLAKKNVFYCKLTRFRTFYTLKISLERNFFFPSVTRRSCLVVGQNLYGRYLSRLKGYRFQISATLCHLNRIDAPYTHNFEILKSLEQTQKSEKKLNHF